MNLTEWLRDQLDKDEQVAREASGDTWVAATAQSFPYSHAGDVYAIAHDGVAAMIAHGHRCGPDISAEQSSAHIARYNPARVLAEVAAKRTIVDDHDPDWPRMECPTCCAYDGNDNYGREVRPRATYPCQVVRLLAAPYVDRPGYDEAWRPVGAARG